jgi:shikimate kinase
MGSGKSTVGRLLAARWAVPFVDLDVVIGDIPALFARGGEAGFRRREQEALAQCVRGVGVLALGGGTVVDPANRALLADWRLVVLLADAGTLRGRVGTGEGRPLAGALERLLEERAEAWRLAGPQVWTAGMGPDAVADRVEALCTSP